MNPKHQQRRADRARQVAELGQAGHPMAKAAADMHARVSILEDQLDKERTLLVTLLRMAGKTT